MYKTIKGTYDILPEESKKWQYIEQIIRTVGALYHYEEIRTPIIEHTEVFTRTSGASSDIVSKEMFRFTTIGKDDISLRPEGTAPVMRAYVEHKLFGSVEQPVKLYSCGPMFRYEQPQKGRQRQFHQFSVEAIGAHNPVIDVEIMTYATTVLETLGIESYQLHLNTLGDAASRLAYRKALVEHFSQVIDSMCVDCKRRLIENPLRILDCKQDAHHAAMLSAPKMIDYLTPVARDYFDHVCAQLDAIELPYVIDNKLVRGLDYYNHTIFEFISTDQKMGAQSTLCAGGRYDGMSSEFGYEAVPAIGFGMGMERLLLAIDFEQGLDLGDSLDAYVIANDEISKQHTFEILTRLRTHGYSADMDYLNRAIKTQFKAAKRTGARFILTVSNEGILNKTVQVHDTLTNIKEVVDKQSLIAFIDTLGKEQHHG